MEKLKIYLDPVRNAYVVCHTCGKTKRLDFSSREIPRSGLVKCSCGNTFVINFERRKHYRKQLKIHGRCFTTGDPVEGVPVELADISKSGIQLLKKYGKQVQPLEKIRVVFPLRDETIDCIISVRDIQSGKIRGIFMELDEHSRKALGFFLLP